MRLIIIALISTIILSHSMVSAQELAAKPDSGTRIEVNNEKGDIRFYVEGELSAVLTKDGFHVLKGIFYGGQIVDYGKEGFANLVEKVDGATNEPTPLP